MEWNLGSALTLFSLNQNQEFIVEHQWILYFQQYTQEQDTLPICLYSAAIPGLSDEESMLCYSQLKDALGT